ncbi:MAG: acyl-CoA dehydrogenase family protein [Burkholderiaceae bacterium]|nr:acyl-CoA dehydrogenase family protein [Burkholderiaceae bacterium]
MNFQLNDEQTHLQDSLARLLRERHGFDTRRRAAATAQGWSDEAWADLVGMGLTALVVPEACDGLGGGAVDLYPVMVELGRALRQEPYLESAVLGTLALAAAGDDAVRNEFLSRAASGQQRLGLARGEQGRESHAGVSATRQGDGWLLSGTLPGVPNGADALQLAVTVTVADAAQAGPALFLMDSRAAGVSARAFQRVDQSPAADLVLRDVPARLLAAPSPGTGQALERVLGVGAAALCAEALGVAKAAMAMTVEYVKTRKQFGHALWDNQVVRHRCAEMLVALDTCESMALLAAIAADNPGGAESRRELAQAKLLVGREGLWVCEQAVQLHGGIGMTDEYPVGHYLQRMLVIGQTLGDADALIDFLALRVDAPFAST